MNVALLSERKASNHWLGPTFALQANAPYARRAKRQSSRNILPNEGTKHGQEVKEASRRHQ